ncbi:sodium:proton antiporter [Pseudidiomarina sp. 1APP75-32.1]|uniref:Sodium:proton antiporter n=1 Tax=Pseudidiomarina terrestris TaxID=2820060 RepID=A0AAW7QWW3_9GAMM|nr:MULTISPECIES: sodium:proton antiporter [unclassified Pseudidiomarina]MDN7124657.1 sodium:proton antiporter [Pseudidiomarina sp. 1APP75-32.1]MDN7126795.1 sodium:proton antiporter [Pseudidiomarina sp. 1APR75-33.1]MDN7129052.1 sodium:proton antiporter [Pseudidiomarina sp. 1APR75-15]MDN7136646.1 sodium:proton antiporter [Pseudidiomarina sp. 1ASP75-14]
MSSMSALALIGVLSILCQWSAWRLKIPAILPLLLVGMLVGPGLGWLHPNTLFGDLLFPVVSLSVAIILFEGSLTLKLNEIRGHGRMVTHLVSIGVLVTWIVASVVAYLLIDFGWELAALFGALVVVTGPTVIMPMLRSVRPKSNVANILRWEGIIIDPIGALLAVLVYEFIIASQGAGMMQAVQAFTITIGVGFALGFAAGKLLGTALRKEWFPHYLKNVATLAIVLGVFAASNALQHESGLLTVTVMGMVMANTRNLNLDDILEFKETLSVLLISGLFIILAARLDMAAFSELGMPAVVLLAVIIFVVRPLSVWLSAIGTKLNFKEKILLSWIAPRGIVAAAVSALFALKLQQDGWAEAELLVPLVFLVILSTVVLQSLTAKPLAHALKLREPPAHGFLIFGANITARRIAKALKEQELPVLLADTNWENIKQARMENLPVYFGNPTSDHAENNMDLTGIGRVLILSPYKQLNPVVALHFMDWFSRSKIYGLPTNEHEAPARNQLSESYRERLKLFGKGVTFSKLASLTFQGAQMKTTNLTENFNFTDYQKRYGNRAIPMFAMDERKSFHVFTTDHTFEPKPGWQIIALVTVEETSEEQAVKQKREKED